MDTCPSCERSVAADAVVCAACGESLVPAPLADLFPVGTDGRYEILRKIGEGGMGVVYEARHTVIGKRVAIKVLLDKYVAKAEIVARLLQEARLASSIGHENIIDITDFGETADGRTFVVMEFLDGESLHDLLQRENCLPPARAIPIVRQIASALGAAHEKGVVHRDVKPENVFITHRAEHEFVKVVDFGISKAVKPDPDSAISPRLTTTGMLLGTPLYLSPEQSRGEEDLNHQIDIYALGVVLYEVLTGEVPFHGVNYLSIISQILEKEAQPPSELRTDLGLSKDLDAVVARAMAKDRRQRYQTMAELDADLARLESGLKPRARSVPPVPRAQGHLGRQIFLWTALVVGIVVAVAWVMPRFISDDEARTPTPVTEVPTPVPLPLLPPPVPALPATVHVQVTSQPSGAEIWWDAEKKGLTPTTLDVPRGDRAIALVLKLDGFDDAQTLVVPTSDLPVDVPMHAKPAPPRPTRRPTARPPRPEPDRGPTSGGEIKPSPFGK